MREQLLGYLMGALDEAEFAEVQAALAEDPKLAAECAQLEQTLAPLGDDDAWIEPPPRLAERTIAWVGAQAQKGRESNQANTPAVEPAVEHEESRALASLSPTRDVAVSRTSRWRLADMVVAGAICLAAAMLFFPAIAHSRKQAAIMQCQNNLRQLGAALVSYSQNRHGEFPLVPTEGNLAIAGMYAPTLKEAALVTDDSLFVCPGSQLAREGDFVVPAVDELERAGGKQLTFMQRRLGGSYGYAFGYTDNDGLYCANVNRSRPRFALLADAPSLHLEDRKSANHGGCGQNVLFEDMHVDYLQQCCMLDSTDNVFLSDRGFVEAGLHYNDAVIGNSAAGPILGRFLTSKRLGQ